MHEYDVMQQKAMSILLESLGPYVRRVLEEIHGPGWMDQAKTILKERRSWEETGELHLDVQASAHLMDYHWDRHFKHRLAGLNKTLIQELKTIRNNWAHQREMTDDDVYRMLDTMSRLLRVISTEKIKTIEAMKSEVLRRRFESLKEMSFPDESGSNDSEIKELLEELQRRMEVLNSRDATGSKTAVINETLARELAELRLAVEALGKNTSAKEIWISLLETMKTSIGPRVESFKGWTGKVVKQMGEKAVEAGSAVKERGRDLSAAAEDGAIKFKKRLGEESLAMKSKFSLARISQTKEIRKLIPYFADDDAQVRRATVRALADLGKEAQRALPSLVVLKDDPNPEVRLAVQRAIEDIEVASKRT